MKPVAWIGGALLVGILSVVAWMAFELERRAGSRGEAVLFTVARGESFGSVTERLAGEDLIAHPLAVRWYAAFRRFDRRVHAGTYRIEPAERSRDVLRKLVHGDIYKVAVTIPEGYLQRDIAGVLAAEVGVDSTAFADLLPTPGMREGFDIEGPSLEGYLFPDTYRLPWGIAPEAVAGIMTHRLMEIFDDRAERRALTIGLSRHEALTLASIIEAEARRADERGLVSAVYHNRLKKGMRLEADPTVAYAMGGYRGRLYYKDLEIDSPYNTYKNPGLPPGPICNPGAAAIHAALYPDSTCRALYFVAQGDGGHIFSNTLEDHVAAVREVRKAAKP